MALEPFNIPLEKIRADRAILRRMFRVLFNFKYVLKEKLFLKIIHHSNMGWVFEY